MRYFGHLKLKLTVAIKKDAEGCRSLFGFKISLAYEKKENSSHLRLSVVCVAVVLNISKSPPLLTNFSVN